MYLVSGLVAELVILPCKKVWVLDSLGRNPAKPYVEFSKVCPCHLCHLFQRASVLVSVLRPYWFLLGIRLSPRTWRAAAPAATKGLGVLLSTGGCADPVAVCTHNVTFAHLCFKGHPRHPIRILPDTKQLYFFWAVIKIHTNSREHSTTINTGGLLFFFR